MRLLEQGVATGWGPLLDVGLWQMLDDSVAGQASINVSGGDVTLTSVDFTTDQARCAIIKATGNPIAARIITAPVTSKVYLFNNDITTNFTVTLRAGVGDPGVAVRPGKTVLLYAYPTTPAMKSAQTNPIALNITEGVSASLNVSIVNRTAGAITTPFRYYSQGNRMVATLVGHTSTISTTAWDYDLAGAGFTFSKNPYPNFLQQATVIEAGVEVPCYVNVFSYGLISIFKQDETLWTAGSSRTLPFDWTMSWPMRG